MNPPNRCLQNPSCGQQRDIRPQFPYRNGREDFYTSAFLLEDPFSSLQAFDE
jgi:hypothetical protein